MAIAACLLIYSLAVMVLTPWVLPWVTRSGWAPRAAVTAWGAALASVVTALVGAPIFLATSVLFDRGTTATLLSKACVAMVGDVAGGRYGTGVQIGVLAVATALVARLVGFLARSLRVGWVRGNQHAEAARLVGRRVAGVEAMVLDSPTRAAYCLPGRPHTIVVTTAVIEALTDRELAAVLAHERAHLQEHHHLIVALARGLARVFPRIPLFTTGARELARLVELCADDAAARRHGPRTVSDALLAMLGSPTLPPGALAVGGEGALMRADRLLAPPARAHQARLRVALTTMTVLLLAGPVITVALSANGISLCVLPGT